MKSERQLLSAFEAQQYSKSKDRTRKVPPKKSPNSIVHTMDMGLCAPRTSANATARARVCCSLLLYLSIHLWLYVQQAAAAAAAAVAKNTLKHADYIVAAQFSPIIRQTIIIRLIALIASIRAKSSLNVTWVHH